MTSTTGMQRERHSGELDLFGLYLNEVGRLVGCGNLRMAGELPVRRTHAWYGASRPPHCGEPVHAVEARLPHPVPLHPTARAPGPREPRQGLGAHGAPPPAQRPTPPGPTTQARARRPRPPGGNQPGAPAIPLVLLPGQAGDLAPLAPPVAAGNVVPEVDVRLRISCGLPR